MKTVKRIISVGLLLVTLFIAGYLVFTGRQMEPAAGKRTYETAAP